MGELGSLGGLHVKNKQRQSASVLVPAERRRRVAEILQESGSVSTTKLEAVFGISPMTARRDLSALEQQGRAVRTHGGAVLPGFARREDSFQIRLEQGVEAKQRLARAAVDLMEIDQTVFVDSSSTSYYAARQILESGKKLTMLTNLVPAMELFSIGEAENVELVGIGGSLRKLTLSFVGPHAVRTVRSHFSDKTILSVKGLTRDGYLTDPDPLEAEVKREMIGRSEEPILLIEGNKLDKKGLSLIAHVSEISRVLVADADEARLEEIVGESVEVGRV